MKSKILFASALLITSSFVAADENSSVEQVTYNYELTEHVAKIEQQHLQSFLLMQQFGQQAIKEEESDSTCSEWPYC